MSFSPAEPRRWTYPSRPATRGASIEIVDHGVGHDARAPGRGERAPRPPRAARPGADQGARPVRGRPPRPALRHLGAPDGHAGRRCDGPSGHRHEPAVRRPCSRPRAGVAPARPRAPCGPAGPRRCPSSGRRRPNRRRPRRSCRRASPRRARPPRPSREVISTPGADPLPVRRRSTKPADPDPGPVARRGAGFRAAAHERRGTPTADRPRPPPPRAAASLGGPRAAGSGPRPRTWSRPPRASGRAAAVDAFALPLLPSRRARPPRRSRSARGRIAGRPADDTLDLTEPSPGCRDVPGTARPSASPPPRRRPPWPTPSYSMPRPHARPWRKSRPGSRRRCGEGRRTSRSSAPVTNRKE